MISGLVKYQRRFKAVEIDSVHSLGIFCSFFLAEVTAFPDTLLDTRDD